jgi:hypothetical protein
VTPATGSRVGSRQEQGQTPTAPAASTTPAQEQLGTLDSSTVQPVLLTNPSIPTKSALPTIQETAEETDEGTEEDSSDTEWLASPIAAAKYQSGQTSLAPLAQSAPRVRTPPSAQDKPPSPIPALVTSPRPSPRAKTSLKRTFSELTRTLPSARVSLPIHVRALQRTPTLPIREASLSLPKTRMQTDDLPPMVKANSPPTHTKPKLPVARTTGHPPPPKRTPNATKPSPSRQLERHPPTTTPKRAKTSSRTSSPGSTPSQGSQPTRSQATPQVTPKRAKKSSPPKSGGDARSGSNRKKKGMLIAKGKVGWMRWMCLAASWLMLGGVCRSLSSTTLEASDQDGGVVCGA